MVTDNFAQKSVDAEIAFHLQQIVLLKRRRNAAALVSALPPELLGAIFYECANIEMLDLKDTGKDRKLPACVRLSHVSYIWRALAFGRPELWSIIQVRTATPSSLLKHMYVHAKNAPLSLDLCGFNAFGNPEPPRAMERVVKMVHQSTSRWKSFSFYSDHAPLDKIFSRFTGTFKNLRSFTVVGQTLSAGDLGSLLVFSAPNLRSIQIVPHYSIPVTSPLLLHCSHLTDLEVAFKLDHPSSNLAVPFAFLKLASNIQRLIVRRVYSDGIFALTPISSSLDITHPAIHIPSLQYFELRHDMPLDVQRAILRALRMSKTRVHITIPDGVREAEHFALLRDLVSALEMGSYGVLTSQELWLSWNNVMIWKERMTPPVRWSDVPQLVGELEMFAQTCNPWITFRLPGRLSDTSFVTNLPNYAAVWSLSSLRVLHINMVVPEGLWRVLSALETLESVRVWSDSEAQSGFFLRALAGRLSTSSELPFPALRTLMCAVPSSYGSRRKIDVDTVFGDPSENGETFLDLLDALQSNWAFTLDIRDALIKKGQRARPLLLLELTECMASVLPERLGSFCGVASEVVWDVSWGRKVQADQGRVRVCF